MRYSFQNYANNNVIYRKCVKNLFGLVGTKEVKSEQSGPVFQDWNKLLI